MKRSDLLVAAALFAAVTVVTAAVAHRQGINRDEAYYMEAGEQYASYWERLVTGGLHAPFSDATIGRYWGYNHEHPPLMKLAYGLSWRLFHTCHCAEDRALHPAVARLDSGRHVTLPLFDLESTAFRLPTILCFAALTALVYLFFGRAFGSRAGGLAAALLTALQPRAFFHAQTAGFDLPIAALWVATTVAWWHALGSVRRRPGVAVGVLFGLALATKLQSFFLPLALGGHWLLLRLRGARPPVWPLLWMAVLGPLIFFASWPWLWHDTVRRFGDYLGFHLGHVHYNFEYFGTNYYHPPYPWHEPLGELVTTAPVVLLALAAAGAVVLVRSRRDRADARMTGTLIAASAVVPVIPFLFGNTPIFGETKHWLATMPFLAIAAGVAVAALAAQLRHRALAALLVLVAAAPSAVETARSHPYGLSHYNALAGGAPGGADLGMNRQFWGYSVLGVVGWLDEHLPPRARLYLHDWNHDAYEIYLRERRLRPDIVDAGMEDEGVRASQAALVVHEKHFNKYEYMIWAAYGTVRPVHVLTLDGVPLVTIYERP
jgi:4-amino-4-deoxy-L-arabinose transferase-like glycosyltransferase